MDLLDIFKNPIVLGIIGAILVYVYLNNYEGEDKKKKSKNKEANILTPGVVGIIIWFIATCYTHKSPTTTTTPTTSSSSSFGTPIITGGATLGASLGVNNNNNIGTTRVGDTLGTTRVGDTFGTRVETNLKPLRHPTTDINLPPVDVFIDLAKFT